MKLAFDSHLGEAAVEALSNLHSVLMVDGLDGTSNTRHTVSGYRTRHTTTDAHFLASVNNNTYTFGFGYNCCVVSNVFTWFLKYTENVYGHFDEQGHERSGLPKFMNDYFVEIVFLCKYCFYLLATLALNPRYTSIYGGLPTWLIPY